MSSEPTPVFEKPIGEAWDSEALARVLQDIYLELMKELRVIEGRLASLETFLRDQHKR